MTILFFIASLICGGIAFDEESWTWGIIAIVLFVFALLSFFKKYNGDFDCDFSDCGDCDSSDSGCSSGCSGCGGD